MKNSSGTIRLRQKQILDYIRKKQFAEVAELADAFQVSSVTIRKDLDLLAEQGKVIRQFGGAECPDVSPSSLHLGAHATEEPVIPHEEELLLRRISQKAASFAGPGSIIFLNNSALASRVIEFIDQEHVSVITNRLEALSARRSQQVSLTLTGGTVSPEGTFLSGAVTLDTFMRAAADLCILGLDGTPEDRPLSAMYMENAHLDHLLAQQTVGRVVVLCPPSQLEDRNSILYHDTTAVTDLITTSGADPDRLTYFENAGVSLHLV